MAFSKMVKLGKQRSVIREIFEEGKNLKKMYGENSVYDFSLGNPNIPCPDVVNETLIKLLNEKDDVHLYTSSAGDEKARKSIADYLSKTYSCSVDYNKIYMTCGCAASLTITLNAILNEGDEVILLTPCFPEYFVFVEKAGGVAKKVSCRDSDLQMDINAIENAITDKTKAIIVNSPNNPTGVVYSEENINALSLLLSKIEREKNQSIFVISDEPYRELVYDGNECPYLPKMIKNTISCYSFSKSLSLPGERIGYICVNTECKDSDDIFCAIQGSGRSLGYVCAPSIFQKMIPYIIGQTSDISKYDENRKILFGFLNKLGFEIIYPQGAFYLFMKSPCENAQEFCDMAKKYNILIVRSDEFGKTGYVRIAYCVSKECIINSEKSWELLAKECFK